MPDMMRVGLGLKSTLSGDLRKELTGVSSFATKAKSLFAGVGKAIFSAKGLIAGFAAGLTIRGISNMVKGVADLHDQFSKLNDKLGISVETLSSLKFAGEQTGVQWNQLSVALQRAVRRLQEFKDTGKGTAAGAIQALGIGSDIAGGATLEDLLPKISDGFKNLKTDAERVRVAFQLFDTEGVNLVRLFKLGSTEVGKLQEEAKRLGIVLTKEDTEGAVKFKDSLNSLSKSFEGLKNKAIGPLLEPLAGLVDQFTKVAVDIRPKISEFFTALAKQLKDLDVSSVAAAFTTLATKLGDLAIQLIKLLPLIAEMVKVTLQIPEFAIKNKDKGLFDWLDNLILGYGINRMMGSGGAQTPTANKKSEYFRYLEEQLKAEVAKMGLKEEKPLFLPGAGSSIGTALPDQYSASFFKKGMRPWGAIGSGIEEVKGPVRSFFEEYRQMASDAGRITNMTIGTALFSMEDAFSGLITKTMSWKDAVKHVTSSILSDLTRIIFRLTAMQALGFLFPTKAASSILPVPSVVSSSYALGGAGSTPPMANGGVINAPAGGGLVTIMAHKKERVSIEPLDKAESPQVIVNQPITVYAQDATTFDESWKASLARNTEQMAAMLTKYMGRNPRVAGAIRR